MFLFCSYCGVVVQHSCLWQSFFGFSWPKVFIFVCVISHKVHRRENFFLFKTWSEIVHFYRIKYSTNWNCRKWTLARIKHKYIWYMLSKCYENWANDDDRAQKSQKKIDQKIPQESGENNNKRRKERDREKATQKYFCRKFHLQVICVPTFLYRNRSIWFTIHEYNFILHVINMPNQKMCIVRCLLSFCCFVIPSKRHFSWLCTNIFSF